MTDRELMQQALEALETNQYAVADAAPHRDVMAYNDAITALRERMEQPIIKNYLGKDNSEQPQRTHWEGCEEVHPECRKPEQEPVAWRNKETGEFCTGGFLRKDWARWTPLYTTPPRREWVGLTDEELEVLEVKHAPPVHPDVKEDDWWEFARAIEAKLKEKNT